MKKVVSFSGGRTSAYLCFLAVEQFGRENVDFIFCDTGAEHPATYEFIKQCDEYFGLNLVCLRGMFDTPLGTANHYKVGGTEIIGPDCEPFAGMMQKYGTPYAPSGGMCSRAMKEEIYTQYCNKKYGRGQYETWLGIRIDEPARLNTKERKKRVLCYLAEISDFDKQDILDWWQAMPFNLQLEEHLGNCVFCIKKSINKVALAARDEPEMLKQFLGCIAIANPREDLNRSFPKEIMYRGRNSLLSVVQKFADHSRDEIADTLRGMKKQESGSCTESCEGFSDEAETEAAPSLLNEAIHMNNYARRLTELKAQPCHKLKEVGDQWRTPPALFWGVFAKFGPFAWDLFSDGDNAKCPNFYTAEDNALTKDWAKDLNGRKGFANPPYSRSSYEDGQAITGMRNIIDKSILERDKGAKFAFLIKAATSEVWWPEGADHVCFIRGRISFDLPDWFIPADKKQEASSAGFACAIAVFDKDWHGEPFSYVNRDDLLRDGQVMLDMICAAAKSLRAAGSEAGTVDPIEPDNQWAAPDDRWHSSVTSLVNSILDLHPEFKKRSIRDRLCDEATELRSNKVGYDDAQTKIISLMKEIGTQKTANNDWTAEVKDLVEAALDVEPCEPTDNFYQALCVIANERLRSQCEKKEVIDYLVIHLREAA